MIRPSAPKAGALPDCATPRRADARRFTGDQTQAESDVRGNERQNMAGTGEVSPEIVPSGTDPVFQTRAELVAPGTPLPWRANGSHIYGPEPQRSLVGQFLTSDGLLVKDRDYAIHAANCFPELVEVARMVVEASDLSGVSGPLGDAARAALAKAVTP